MAKVIVGIGGRKQSGKGASADLLLRREVATRLWPGLRAGRDAFARPIKEMCISLLGLDWHSVYGTDEQKNAPTRLRWEDWPFRLPGDPESGPMSGRSAMQRLGTLFNAVAPGCFARRLLADAAESEGVVVVDDVRMPHDVGPLLANPGTVNLVVWLTRNPFPDPDATERGLEDYSHPDFVVVDNRGMDAGETARAVLDVVSRRASLPF